MGIGSLLSMPLTGHLCRRFGTRSVIIVTAALACLVAAGLGQVGSIVELGVVLFGFGLTYGAWDVSMNVQGSAAETLAGRNWMPRYHAAWSAGSILGAALGALAAEQKLAVSVHFPLVAIGSAGIAAVGLTMFIDERAELVNEHEHKDGRRARVISRRLILIGIVVLASTVVEGAASDWLAIYLADERHVSYASAALAFTVFAVAMTVGRVLGTPITARLGRAFAVRIGGFLAMAGVLLTILSPFLVLNYAGSLLWAAGICLVFPAGVSAAGESQRPAESIAMVTTIGYGSILIGPPLIGALADRIGLGNALLVLVLLGAVLALLAPVLQEPRTGSPTVLATAAEDGEVGAGDARERPGEKLDDGTPGDATGTAYEEKRDEDFIDD
jgi:MFS family permease